MPYHPSRPVTTKVISAGAESHGQGHRRRILPDSNNDQKKRKYNHFSDTQADSGAHEHSRK